MARQYVFQALVTKLLACRAPRFGYSVSRKHETIAMLSLNFRLEVTTVRQDTMNRAALLQPETIALTHQHGRTVAGVGIIRGHFVIVANKGRLNYISNLKVAGPTSVREATLIR